MSKSQKKSRRIIPLGDSLVVSIPKKFVKEHGLEKGQELNCETDHKEKTIIFKIKEKEKAINNKKEITITKESKK